MGAGPERRGKDLRCRRQTLSHLNASSFLPQFVVLRGFCWPDRSVSAEEQLIEQSEVYDLKNLWVGRRAGRRKRLAFASPAIPVLQSD